mgnify:CR=1 FL=1
MSAFRSVAELHDTPRQGPDPVSAQTVFRGARTGTRARDSGRGSERSAVLAGRVPWYPARDTAPIQEEAAP